MTTFIVLDLDGFDTILGVPWLKHYDPLTKWSTGLVTFDDGDSIRPIGEATNMTTDKCLTMNQMTAW